MKIGFLFPGQGAQYIGMGKDLYDNFEEYRNVYQKVNEITGIDVADLTLNKTEEILNQTKNTQICILTMSLAILKLLENKNIKAEVSSGLSLGEYSALIYSKAISFEDGVKIVKRRGELMQELCPKGDWSMAAILGLDEDKVNQICSNVATGYIATANYNCPGQIVVSGEKNAVAEAMEIATEVGAKKAVELKTSGPFHTIKLSDASKELKKELENITINEFQTKVVKNLDGKTYTNKDNVRDILADHIINSVRFEQGIQTMLNEGVDTFIEIGPGKTLSGFVKRTSRDVEILNINDMSSFEKTIDKLKV